MLLLPAVPFVHPHEVSVQIALSPRCINVALCAIVFVYSNLYMWRREVNEAKDVHVAFAVMTIFEWHVDRILYVEC